ncbi:dTDP-4-dehydrorhamnose reductase [Pseudoalteromonas piscicida]|uniref:dTDP-4-dehydrorhamnose reductase n=1 Tax=Pseudoalteromonas piscicida TaxID=43662 RepID=A0A2A5JVW3_PSEO7|nr:dTDP-4-dehydrorhamnose reductase [Pseudoalteromonas piscicida]PCK33623.1 dTDP-4-dehydrorhamnose reductase [Pseudoalteromonas piscicida]
MDVLIIGKNGQVAWELIRTTPEQVKAIALGRTDIDITSAENIKAAVLHYQPKVIINASAYTAVDKAETDKEAAYLINATAVELLAKIACQHNIRLIHVSTDFVFDGTKSTPYRVDDVTNPINVYGASKLAGEEAIKKYSPDNACVVRTSWVYSSHGNNFVKTMLRLMSEREQLSVVADQVGSPTSANGLAKYLWKLAEQDTLEPVYHYQDLGVASWYDFAVEIQKKSVELGLLGNKIPIEPISSEQYPTPAKRPSYSLMNCNNDTFTKVHWTEALYQMLLSKTK